MQRNNAGWAQRSCPTYPNTNRVVCTASGSDTNQSHDSPHPQYSFSIYILF